MRRSWIAVIAAAVLGLGVVGAAGTKAGGYLSHITGRGPAATQTSAAAMPRGGQSTTHASAGQGLIGQQNEGGGQGGD